MIYCFDIDGTLCTITHGRYELAQPYADAIERVNSLYDAGHRVLLFTARGSTTGKDWSEVTKKQLHAWGVKHHELVFGKPEADVFVDDKAMGPVSWKEIGLGLHERHVSEVDNCFRDPKYLDVTYSCAKAPKGAYPYLLCTWLLNNIFGSTGTLLDLGCGRGDHMQAFSSLGFEVSGVDLAVHSGAMQHGADVRCADLERGPLPFPENSFDFIFCKSVIEHMHYPHKLLKHAYCVLKPAGKMVVMTPSWSHTYWGPFYVDHTHVTPFTAISLADALTVAGFQQADVRHFYQLPFLWKWPFLRPFVQIFAALPIPYRPMSPVSWPESFNKLVRFSKEVMLLGVGVKPESEQRGACHE